jgi:hypothetical protein
LFFEYVRIFYAKAWAFCVKEMKYI